VSSSQESIGTSASLAYPVNVPASNLLNGFIGSHVLYALIMTGALETLEQRAGPIPVAWLARSTNCDRSALRSLLRAADRLGLVSFLGARDEVEISQAGREAYRVRGYFTAAVGGFGDVFRRLDSITAGSDRFGKSVFQNGSVTALGCSQNWTFQRPIFDATTAGVQFTKVADLGSGAGTRLIHLVASRRNATGIGIDIDSGACRLARANIRSAGLDDRITIVEGDILDVVTEPQEFPEIVDADLVMSYFLLHHFVDQFVCGASFLRALRLAFTQADQVVFADGFQESDGAEGEPAPMFTMAYRLFHDLLGVRLQTLDSQRALFASAGYQIARQSPFGHPLEWLFVLRPDRGKLETCHNVTDPRHQEGRG